MTTELKPTEDTKIQKPKLYAVTLVNDDFTPMEFVIQVLLKVFGKTIEEAEQLTMDIHNKGKGVCGIYPFEIAETKAMQVEQTARTYEFPLKADVAEA